MAVGSQGTLNRPAARTLAEQWNGTAWKVVPTPPPPVPGGTALAAVSCTGPGACMAAGYDGFNTQTGSTRTLAEQWNGARWTVRPTPTPNGSGSLAGVACTAARACLAVGGRLNSGLTLVSATLAEQWNGAAWTVRTTPSPGGANFAGLDSIACTGPKTCMATGGGARQEGESGFTVAESWNGTSWSLLRSPSPGSFSDELAGVSCSGQASCMAVGEDQGIGKEETLAEAWNGTRWRVIPTPRP
jgi:hypothetical protein